MTDLPSSHNVARYCSNRCVTENGRITSVAFDLFPKDQGYLSVNHLEKIGQNTSNQLDYLRPYYIKKILKGKTPKKSGAKIAFLNINKACNLINTSVDTKSTLKFKSNNKSQDPSYSGIYGIEIEDSIVSELLSQAIHESYKLIQDPTTYSNLKLD